jgi:hypothetical protein
VNEPSGPIVADPATFMKRTSTVAPPSSRHAIDNSLGPARLPGGGRSGTATGMEILAETTGFKEHDVSEPNHSESLSEYLVISRGQWDAALPAETIQQAIDDFYTWHAELAGAGKVRAGQRLAPEGRRVSQAAIIDGPFAEAKEVVGGYWFVTAASLDEAAQLMSASPCLACGLWYEIRPIDPERCSATATTTETPVRR